MGSRNTPPYRSSTLPSERRGLVAAILVGVIGPEVFIVQPGFVQGLVEHLGFDDSSAGYAASIEVWGITATTLLMTFFAAFPLTALPLVGAFPNNGETAAAVEADAVNLPVSLKSLALAAMFAYFVAQGVAWAYLFLIGTAGGLSEQRVATALTLSQL